MSRDGGETNDMEVTLTLNTGVLHSTFESTADDLVGVFVANKDEEDTNKIKALFMRELIELERNILLSKVGRSNGNERTDSSRTEEIRSDLSHSSDSDECLSNDSNEEEQVSEMEHLGTKRSASPSCEPLSKLPRTKATHEPNVNIAPVGVKAKQIHTPKISTTKGCGGGGKGISGLSTPTNSSIDKTQTSHSSAEVPSQGKSHRKIPQPDIRPRGPSTKKMYQKKLPVKRLNLSKCSSAKQDGDTPKTRTYNISPRPDTPHRTPLKKKGAKARTPTRLLSSSQRKKIWRCTGEEKLKCPVCSIPDCGKCKYCL